MRALISIVPCLLLAACGGKHEQTFAEGLQIACSAPDQVPNGSVGERVGGGLAKVRDQITNREVIELLGSMANIADKRGTLRAAVEKAHLSQCTLLELWSPPAAPPAPGTP